MIFIKKVILIVLSVIVVIATAVAFYSLYKKTKDQEEQIQVLTDQINQMSMEDLVEVYVAGQQIKHGTMVDADMLQTRSWNRASVSPNMITDLSTIEGKIWKIDVAAEGPITIDMVAEETFGPTDRLQLVAVDAITPSLQVGDYIDLRMVTPSGINYVVMSKKRVTNIYDAGIEVVMSEAELMVYSGLIIDQFLHTGTMVYTSKYLEPTLQKSNYAMYVPPKEIQDYMKINANMIYPYLASDNVQGLRSYIESTQPWNLYGPSTFQTVTQSIIDRQDKITRSNDTLASMMKSARAEYIQKQGQVAQQNNTQVQADQQAAGTNTQVPQQQATTGGINPDGSYTDANGVQRDANGDPIMSPGDLATGVAPMGSGSTATPPPAATPADSLMSTNEEGGL